jgi:hypothetical protein
MVNNVPVAFHGLENAINADFRILAEVAHQEGEGGALTARDTLGKSAEREEG